MCGICCMLTLKEGDDDKVTKDCMKYGMISHRGPDATDTREVKVFGAYHLTLIGHVLHLRGQLTKQPLQHQNGDLLLWNAEIFGGIEVADGENDTEIFLQCLSKELSPEHIMKTMATVEGPWSFIYWQNITQTLYFGRDMFGRRSLLWHLPTTKEDVFLLSSVKLDNYEFTEVPSVGLFSVCVKNERVSITMYPRDEAVWPGTTIRVKTSDPAHIGVLKSSYFQIDIDGKHVVPMSIPKLNREIIFLPTATKNETKDENTGYEKMEKQDQQTYIDDNKGASSGNVVEDKTPFIENDIIYLEESFDNPQKYLGSILQNDSIMSKLSDQLTNVLLKAVTTRVYNQVDLPMKNRMCDLCKERSFQKLNKYGSESKARKDCNSESNIDQLQHLEKHNRTTKPNICSCENDIANHKASTQQEVKINRTDIFESDKLKSQVDITDCSLISVPTLSTTSGPVICGRAKVAVLFSGGIDSAVITALVDRCLPMDEPVDLLNVAFEQKVKLQARKKGRSNVETGEWNVPDRITGYTALSELNSNRPWNFIEVNITVKELQEVRSNHIQHLVYPLETVLDDSIGCAVWFAARGHGVLGNTQQKGQPYKSTSKVILCGMGADEQLAGYSRHRGKYMENGIEGLLDEIEMEVNRISARNLGRDDRIITDHGKEARFPFLDENVVNFLQKLPIQYKADLSLPRGIGEKLLLRLCACQLGLIKTATFPKRAIQFGSRIAKTENSKEKGSDKCQRLNTS